MRAAWQEQMRQQQVHNEAMADLRYDVVRAQIRAAEIQKDINERPRRKYVMIVATDLHGAFSKDGQIPWKYAEDFKWFKEHTTNHICVMGRTTYDDIDKRLGDKAAESVLPNRQCFVVTSKPLERQNATPIARLADLDVLLGVDTDKTVFFCGGERIYREAIAYCDEILMTVVNKEVDGDRFVPRDYIMKYFEVSRILKDPVQDDLRFVVYRRKQ